MVPRLARHCCRRAGLGPRPPNARRLLRQGRPTGRGAAVQGGREVVLAITCRRAIQELAVRLVWLRAEALESEREAGKSGLK